MGKKIHIGFHKAGSTFLQQIVFPKVPNYKGRNYNNSTDKHTELYLNQSVKKGCENILNYYNKFDDHFISNELFSKLRHKKLFELLKTYNYNDVLVFERNLDDLINSRKRHRAPDFFLQKKIDNGNIDEEVINHYSTKKLSEGIINLTVINFEKFFSGDKKEIKKLSEFLEYDVEDVVVTNLHKKINANRNI
jgi:hypothetical protein